MAKGRRLYCPKCGDSSFFTEEQLASVKGSVDCGNHFEPVTMVNLAEYLNIMGFGTDSPLVEQEEEVEFA